jgi:hypothetical protein
MQGLGLTAARDLHRDATRRPAEQNPVSSSALRGCAAAQAIDFSATQRIL